MKTLIQHKTGLAIAALALLAVLWTTQRGAQGLHGGVGAALAPMAASASAQAADAVPIDGPQPGAPALALRPAAPATGFARAPDLFAFAQSLMPAADRGDAEALWQLSQVQDYCGGYASDPGSYARDTRTMQGLELDGVNALVAARQRVSRRCSRFVPEDGLATAVLEQRRRAASAGNLAAEAALLAMGQPLAAGDDYTRDLVQRVRTSHDPDALLAISPAMGLRASGSEAVMGEISGTGLAELAWQLAACRQGLDCSSNSNLMTSYCANGGVCSQDPSQDFPSFVFDAAVPRQGAERLDNMVNTLIDSSGGGL
ncbi:hypothetical protein [Pseudoxanthomonas dokdonensis]|uniref:Uncharacterized protein n=1 Tax=Pseudoxanthomonas dokdonensis TaxID=344882 RepID=A0A0R0CYF4_9GAMM|nr:hypothetical protein [Pseudoxanthomonas dokdonensis]KRG71586.1 hypothetical protein ABB29_02135 [Pseudoxanthomonas dokdonensis]